MENFTRIKKIGKGTYGDVLLVERKSDQLHFAVKRVDLQSPVTHIDPQMEVKVLQSLDHPNIIKYYDAFEHNQKLCIVMEYADDVDLAIKIKEQKVQGVHFDESQVVTHFIIKQVLCWFTQLCLAINFLHNKKILHRDIKAQNVFLSKKGMIKLGDFSISRFLGDTQEFASTTIGTPFYLSPEICEAKSYNHKIDIWMLGCLLHELVSLERPFQGESINVVVQNIIKSQPAELPPDVSPFIVGILGQMLDKNPDNRPEAQTLLQHPEIQIELQKLQFLQIYKNINLKLSVSESDIFFQKKLRTPPGKEKERKKMSQNSIHYLIEQARQQQQSPISTKRSYSKTPSHNVTSSKVSTPTTFAPIHAISETNSFLTNTKLNTHGLLSQQCSPHFQTNTSQLQQYFFHGLDRVQISTLLEKQPTTEQDMLVQKNKPYQRIMSINTQLEGPYAKKESTESELVTEHQQQTLLKQKQFAFTDHIFNQNTPTSPNRTILFSDFLRKKLGEDKFSRMKMLLENSSDPMTLLEEHRELVTEIIGESNMDCIRIFKILISSSVTPPGSHFRTRSVQNFAVRCQRTQSDNIQDLIAGVEDSTLPIPPSIGMNPQFEISFKNPIHFQNEDKF